MTNCVQCGKPCERGICSKECIAIVEAELDAEIRQLFDECAAELVADGLCCFCGEPCKEKICHLCWHSRVMNQSNLN